jgi:hypothetical protein
MALAGSAWGTRLSALGHALSLVFA